MATTAQIEAAARGDRFQTWGVPRTTDARGTALLSLLHGGATYAAIEREERWHAARLARPHGVDVLDALDLTDVPASPEGWCTCPTPMETS
ncbi:hypothetical protein ABT061_15680 [Streptosporangium sp. NPDC002544]|uniref:hypothetical protein n=1 Tax=Streptosporangium sp. NPDC002544 TaxID=3154538 RepID=UPI00332AAFD6